MSWNDSDVLQQTRQEPDEHGKVRFAVDLPSGRQLVTEYMDPDDARKHVIQWCEHVRNAIASDEAEKEAQRKRDRDLADEVQEEVKNEAVEEVTNPVEYAVHQRDMYIARVEVLEERLLTTETELKKMREHLEQWNVIVHKLRGETDE